MSGLTDIKWQFKSHVSATDSYCIVESAKGIPGLIRCEITPKKYGFAHGDSYYVYKWQGKEYSESELIKVLDLRKKQCTVK